MPHPCGIATYTYDLATAAFPRQIVAVQPPDGPTTYPAEVRHRIRRDEYEDYPKIAAALNDGVVDVVSLQHDPSIYGGPDGDYVLALAQALTLPLVTTLHVVPRTPTAGQRRVITQLAAASAVTVALSSAAEALLVRTYGLDPGRVEVVPHGVPHLPLVDPDTIKPRLDLVGRRVLLSFGLLAPGKGYEAAIAAMPAIAAADPTALYVILGATAPDRVTADGEAYRESLVALVEQLGMGAHVRFVDRFMGRVELANWVEASDVFLAPYLDLDRVTSGTLSYAMGAGKAIVATPFPYAKERLARGRGILVAPGSPDTLAEAVLRLLGDRKARDAYGAKAYEATRDQVWSSTGAAYGQIFTRVARPSHRPSPPVRRLAPTGR
jgi:glycosyltransferase involved in cell wall biosynthesis